MLLALVARAQVLTHGSHISPPSDYTSPSIHVTIQAVTSLQGRFSLEHLKAGCEAANLISAMLRQASAARPPMAAVRSCRLLPEPPASCTLHTVAASCPPDCPMSSAAVVLLFPASVLESGLTLGCCGRCWRTRPGGHPPASWPSWWTCPIPWSSRTAR